MLKKWLCVLLAGTVVASLSACGSGTQSGTAPTGSENASSVSKTEQTSTSASEKSGDKTEVSMYTWWGDAEQDLGEAVVKEFEQEHPEIDIKENYIPYNDYLSKINTLIAAKQTPDVFFIQEFLANEWGEKGVVKDLRPLYEAQGLSPEELYLSTALFGTGEHLWAVEFSNTTMCMYYNKEMMQQAGITPPTLSATDPWTWDQFVDAAKKMTRDASDKTPNDEGFDYDNIQAFGALMPTAQNQIQALLYSAGTSVASDDGMTLNITKPEGVRVIQSIADLALKDRCAPTMAAQKSAFSNASVMLMNGQLGMFIDGSYKFPDFVKESFDVGVAQIPRFGEKANNIAWSAPYMIGANTQVEAEAFTFFQYLVNFDNTVNASINQNVSMGNLPHTFSTLNDPEAHKKWADNYNADMAELMTGILKDASRLGECVTLKNFAKIMEQTLIPQLDKVWLGEMDAATAMSTMDEQLASEMQGSWQ